MDMKWLEALIVPLVVGGFFWVLMRYAPGMLVKWLHATFEWAKANEWMRAKPHRVALLVAVIRFLEEEVPDPGTGKEFYADLGARMASLPARLAAVAPIWLKGPLGILVVLMAGSGSKWSEALEKAGDAIDTELDDELKELGGSTQP
jgi:hypothetical protein